MGEDMGVSKRHGWCGDLIEEGHQSAESDGEEVRLTHYNDVASSHAVRRCLRERGTGRGRGQRQRHGLRGQAKRGWECLTRRVESSSSHVGGLDDLGIFAVRN